MRPIRLPFDRVQLHSDLRRTTQKVRREDAYEEIEDIQRAIDGVLQAINYADVVESMREAACEGKGSADLFRFRKNQLWSSFPILFLLKGPSRDNGEGKGQDYFTYHGILSLMDRLERLLDPFEVYHRYDRDTGINAVCVSWM